MPGQRKREAAFDRTRGDRIEKLIGDWLTSSRRDPFSYWFEVSDLVEGAGASRPSNVGLASLMRESYWGEGYLAELASRYGWGAVRQRFLDVRSGTLIQVKRGDFGEALATQYLREVERYEIPIDKLRLKISANQTLPGTDCIAFKVTEQILAEVCYVESKLRIPIDKAVAVKGVKQLEHDTSTLAPEMLTFTARQLRSLGHPLADAVEAYLFSRDREIETFKLLVFHDAATWSEDVLANLQEDGDSVKPLHVYATRVADLKALSDGAFAQLGPLEVVEDDE